MVAGEERADFSCSRSDRSYTPPPPADSARVLAADAIDLRRAPRSRFGCKEALRCLPSGSPAGALMLLLGAFAPRPVAAQYQTDPPADGASAAGQTFPPQASTANSPAWRPPAQMPRDAAGSSEPIRPLTALSHGPIAHVSKGPGTLPNDAGQEWRDYDISPYTLRVTSTNRPEQAIVDWILLDTGYEAWHSDPLGLLSASKRTLRVYHTPQIHAVVGDMVDRFVNSEAESHAFGLRVMTVGSPNWRSKAHHSLHPVPAQSQGVQAWLVSKEDASLLMADLRRRSDFREHSTPHLLVNNGQSTVVAATQTKNYTRDVVVRPGERLARLRSADGADRRRLLAGIPSAVVDRWQDDRRDHQVPRRSGGENDAGDDRRSEPGRPAPKNRNQSPPTRQLQAARAVSLAGRSSAADQSGRRVVPHSVGLGEQLATGTNGRGGPSRLAGRGRE